MENKICENCNNILDSGFDFCPYCSAPITEKAEKLESQKAVNAQLVMLANLIREISDEKTLRILEKYIRTISKNK